MILNIGKRIVEKRDRLLFLVWKYKQHLKYFFGSDSYSAIVMFHHVRNDRPRDILDSCQCTISEFQDFCNYVGDNYSIVSIHDLLNQVAQGGRNLLVISFDDVPSNFYTNAYPILKKHNYPFILYITTDFIDLDGYLTSRQLEILSKDPLCTIGVHTKSHPFLKLCSNLDNEVLRCKEILEQKLGLKIKDFAYPYGTPTAINKEVISFLKNCDQYESAVTTIPGLINSNVIKNRYSLPRIHSKLFISKYKK